MTSVAVWGYVMLAVYTLGVLTITLITRRTAGRGVEQHYLGGRSMSPFLVAVTFVLASTSAGAFVGEPGLAYAKGLPSLWATLSIVVGLTGATILFASRLRHFTAVSQSVTIPSFLGRRYESPALRIITAVVIGFFYTVSLIAMYRGATILFTEVLNVPPKIALAVFTLLVAVYVGFGGFRAVTWTGTVQGLPMILFSVVLIGITLVATDGLSGLSEGLGRIDPALTSFFEGEIFSPAGVVGLYVFWTVVFSSNPHLATKFMALRDGRRPTMAVVLVTVLVLTAIINLNYIIGLGARVMMPDLDRPDFATIRMAIELLPAPITAILMVGILAAIMSTVDAMLLSIGTSVGEDIYRSSLRPEASDQSVLRITRLTVFVVSLIVLIFLLWRTPDFLAIFLVIGMTGVGLALGPPMLAGLFWRRATKVGALSSVVVGVPFYGILVSITDISPYAATLYGALVSFPVMVLVSLFSSGPRSVTVDRSETLAR